MVMPETSIEDIQERLIRLETQSRRLKQIGAVVLLLGAALITMAQAGPQSKTAPLETVSSAPRYQIVFSPHVREDTFLLDTETGQTWRQTQVVDVEGQPTIWHARERLDNDTQFAAWSARQTPNPTNK